MLGGEKREKNRRKQVLEIKREQSNGAIIIIHEQSRIITPGATGSRFFLSKREGRSCSINNRISPGVIRFQLRSRTSVNEPDISSDRIHSARNRISSGPRIKEEEKETKRPDTTPHESSNGRSRTIEAGVVGRSARRIRGAGAYANAAEAGIGRNHRIPSHWSAILFFPADTADARGARARADWPAVRRGSPRLFRLEINGALDAPLLRRSLAK